MPSTQSLLKLLSDDELEVHSNAALTVGVLVEHGTVYLSPQYLHFLPALRPLFEVPSDAPTAKLNARGNALSLKLLEDPAGSGPSCDHRYPAVKELLHLE